MAEISSPSNVFRVVHVEWDEKAGAFKGLPDVWGQHLPEGVSKNETSSKAVNVFGTHVAFPKVPKRLGRLKKKPTAGHEEQAPMTIGTPFNVKHVEHVGVDPRSSFKLFRFESYQIFY
jgi:hypothetical protein